ncbi:MAG: threonine aldolase, partial [Bacteroidetes bacterium HGW-Bacteroidetes-22]
CSDTFCYEAALFCPSGTMANQIAIKVHTRPGDEVLCGDLSHVYHYEGGGISFNSGASVRLLSGDRGRFTSRQVVENIHDRDDIHSPISRLVVVENTCNKGGGSVWDYNELVRISKVAGQHDLKLHLDGARLFNAMTVDGTKPADYSLIFDSISLCLSKGLGAPIGSVLMGSKDFIHKAIRVRKLLGGAMRQSGFLAAAGIYALKNNVDRLVLDHEHATILGKTISSCQWCEKVEPVESNIVIFRIKDHIDEGLFANTLKSSGILCSKFGPSVFRLVTHLDIDTAMIQQACQVFNRIKME